MKLPTTRILVIDDDASLVNILVTAFRKEGYGVLGAGTGEQGLRLFTLTHPHLILLDIALAGDLNGIEVLRQIRSLAPATPVVMVSGAADPARARQALELGALAYVDKPFDMAYLKRVVAMVLQNKPA